MSASNPAPAPQGRATAAGSRDLLREIQVGALLDQLPAILYVADAGPEGHWHYVSRGVESLLGFSVQEWCADPGMWARRIDPRDRERVLAREGELAEPTVPEEYRMRHRNGSTVWVRDEAALVKDGGGRVRWHGVISDISDRKRAEAQLERRADQQSAAATLGKHALEGAALTVLLGEALEAVMRVEGVSAAAVLERVGHGTGLRVRTQRGVWPNGQLPVPGDAAYAGGQRGHAEPLRSRPIPAHSVVGIESAHGVWGELWLASSPERPPAASDLDFVQTIANTLAGVITRRAAEARARYQAVHDPLTGLPNRSFFLDRLGAALGRPRPGLAVVALDIDNFKLINDSLGHAAGDELLMQVAPRLRTVLRPHDLIARFGGDEFVMLLRDLADEQAAAQIGERIVEVFASPFTLSAREHFAKASVGIAVAGHAGSTPLSLVRDADAALYEAKNRGRARYEVFDDAMRTRTVGRLALEDDLRRALQRDQLHVVYQPIVSLRDGSIRSLEALLRWSHPERGPVSPAEFVPVAEESGMIEEIGRWVLQAACAEAARWRAALPAARMPGVGVNLSARQLMQQDFETTLVQVLDATGLDPSALSLEITESLLLEDPQAVGRTIERMSSKLGVRFVLDDFGTGYSSLAYLSGLPIDGLKVDRSFVSALGVNERSRAITTAIVRMAQALSVEVTAEGVETEGQAEALRALGCELAQGFLFHRPLDARTAASLLAEHGRVRPAGHRAGKSSSRARRERVAGLRGAR